VIQTNTPAQDSSGSWADSWADDTNGSMWAAVEPLSGRELFLAQQVNSDVTHKITMRYKSGLSPQKRIRFAQRFFNIITVMNIGEIGYQMQVMAKEIL
jgi:SPP1 family predicted phage head-tail adaptor